MNIENDHIEIAWHIDNVKELNNSLTDDQCREILQRVEKNHDANIGINWDVIQCEIDNFLEEK